MTARRSLHDALGRALEVPQAPTRIVSLVPSQTELLADLGLDEEVVGLTTFCVHPPGWREQKTRIGGTKDVRVERIRELEPDLILANKEENTREIVAALEGLAPVYVTDVSDVGSAANMIRAVGELVGRGERGQALAREIEEGFRFLPAAPVLRVAYLIWREPYMTVGGDTFIHAALAAAKLENVFGGHTRYPEVGVEELRAAAPAAVLLSSEPYPFQAKHVAELSAELPGVKVELIDGELCSWYGSRLRLTPAYLCELRERLVA